MGTCQPGSFFPGIEWRYYLAKGKVTFHMKHRKSGKQRAFPGTYDIKAAENNVVPMKAVFPLRAKKQRARIVVLDSGHLVFRERRRGSVIFCKHRKPVSSPDLALRARLLKRLEGKWVSREHHVIFGGKQVAVKLKGARYQGDVKVTGAGKDLVSIEYKVGAKRYMALICLLDNTAAQITITRGDTLVEHKTLYRSTAPVGADAAALKAAEARIRGVCVGKQHYDTPKLTLGGGRFSVLTYKGSYTVVGANKDVVMLFYRAHGRTGLGRIAFLDDGQLEIQRRTHRGYSTGETCFRKHPRPIRTAKAKTRRKKMVKWLQGTWRAGHIEVVVSANNATVKGLGSPHTGTFKIRSAGPNVLNLDLLVGGKRHIGKIYFRDKDVAVMEVVTRDQATFYKLRPGRRRR